MYDERLIATLRLASYQLNSSEITNEAKIISMPFYDEWKPGEHKESEIYTANGQIWECYASYSNTRNPDITPDNSSWHTFNRPLHGTTPKTALPFYHPTNAENIYRAGEYAIYNNKIIQCKQDTSYSPDKYSQAWEYV